MRKSIKEYIQDVEHQALSRMEFVDSPQLKLTNIPQIWTDTIWEGLAYKKASRPSQSSRFLLRAAGLSLKQYEFLYLIIRFS